MHFTSSKSQTGALVFRHEPGMTVTAEFRGVMAEEYAAITCDALNRVYGTPEPARSDAPVMGVSIPPAMEEIAHLIRSGIAKAPERRSSQEYHALNRFMEYVKAGNLTLKGDR